MAVETDIQAALAAQVGGRCFPLVADVGTAHPYTIFQVISNPALTTLKGEDAGISLRRIQVDCWDVSYGAAKAALKAATTAMIAAGAEKMGDNPDKYDADTKTYAASADFSMWGES